MAATDMASSRTLAIAVVVPVVVLVAGAEQVVEQPLEHIAPTADAPLPPQMVQMGHQLPGEVEADPLSGVVRLLSHGSPPSVLGSLASDDGSGSPLVQEELLLGLDGLAVAIHQ